MEFWFGPSVSEKSEENKMNKSAPTKIRMAATAPMMGQLGRRRGSSSTSSSSSQRRPEEVPRERPALLWSSSRRPPVRTAFTWAVLRI